MATIVDHQIIELATRIHDPMITPFSLDQVNPASYDVRLGDSILIEGAPIGPKEYRKRWLQRKIDKRPYMMKPGAFILGVTEEIISLPGYMEAVFQLKSSRGREGYEHALAGYIDPGFVGRVTLELTNLNQRHELELRAGMLIGQLRFSKTDRLPTRTYAEVGHYHNDMTVQPSKVSPIEQYEEK